jgi:hypothetical protein
MTRPEEVTMKQQLSINLGSTVLAMAMMTGSAGADSFNQIQTAGSPGPLEAAAGAFLPVFEDGDRSGWAFLVHGGLRGELDAKAISDLWLLEDQGWRRIQRAAPRVYDQTLVVAADGRAYEFGGVNANDELNGLDWVTVYSLRRESDTLEADVEQRSIPGPNPGICSEAAAVALSGQSSILHIGGFCDWQVLDNGSKEVWEYLIDANRWQRRADLPAPLSRHSAVASRGQVWVFGGRGPSGASNALFRYDPAADRWDEVDAIGPAPEARDDHRAVVVGESMIVFGGIRSPFFPETIDEVWELDLEALRWSRKADIPSGLARMALDVVPTELVDSATRQVLLFGGVERAWPVPHLLSEESLIYTSDSLDMSDTLAVPSVARVHGRGALCESTLQVFNAGESNLELELTFTPRRGSGGARTTVGHKVLPGVMQTIDDPLSSVFGFPMNADRVGSLLIEVRQGSVDDLMVQSVVSARLDSGEEYGQFFPASRADDALRAGESAYLNTTEDPAANRVNVGLMAVADGTRVIVTPMDPMGSAIAAPGEYRLDRGDNSQINDVHRSFGIESTPDVLIEIRVVSGGALAYASVVDGNGSYSGTSDPTTIQPVRHGSERITLLEIGSIVGGNEYSGSASITNHSDFEARIRADFHRRGAAGVSSSASLTIAAGDTEGFSDLARDLFGATGEVGTVVLQSTNGARISASGREYSIFRDDRGEKVGTAGQLISGATDQDLLTPGRSWHFLGLRQSGSGNRGNRSHLAVFNPNSEAARVTVTVYDGIRGEAEGSRSWSVRPGELMRINNLISRIDPGHDGGDKRIEVQTSRPVHASVFRINRWGDPVTLDACGN